MATKRDVLKVMEMDKNVILTKIDYLQGPDNVKTVMHKELQFAAAKIGIDPKIVSFAYRVDNFNFEEFITDEEVKISLREVAKISIAHQKKKDDMKRKVNAEFAKLERAILLEGAGEVAEMLAKVVESLTEEVNNGL